MSPTPASVVEALTAAETRAHAQRLHAGFLTARDIDADIITAHWNTIADRWPDD